MTEKFVEQNVRIGTIFKNRLGGLLKVVSIKNNVLYECKWLDDSGELSKGSLWQVPTHFSDCVIIEA